MSNARPDAAVRRLSHGFLCAAPFLSAVLAAATPLRIPGVHQAIGLVVFGAIGLAAWALSAHAIRAGGPAGRLLALAGALLLVPFALISLLWVGLGTPWDATPAQNLMRYLVLLAAAVAVTGGFIVLKQSACDAGERTLSTLGFAAGILSGTAYLVWLAFQIGAWSTRIRTGEAPSFAALNDALDTLLFVACVLTYFATAAFGASCVRAGWLSRPAGLALVLVSFVALALVAVRGLSFPDPTKDAAPWYTRPGFIAGIPAIPWIMPHLIGAAVLLRAGRERA